ncbi:hypothetical protein BKA70DRAFT_1428501 [Coprinopsis sp. MPI-PUGE-AT-0042]|nr:hypothetical protein BKA70DRAFT_1428501 [Coprinopsis sp. MPI-PUGE-AT-0042]
MVRFAHSHIAVHPFVPKLLPGLIKVESAMADPDACAVVDRVIKTLCKVGQVPAESDGTDLRPLKKADEKELAHYLFTIYQKHGGEVSLGNVGVMCTSNLIRLFERPAVTASARIASDPAAIEAAAAGGALSSPSALQAVGFAEALVKALGDKTNQGAREGAVDPFATIIMTPAVKAVEAIFVDSGLYNALLESFADKAKSVQTPAVEAVREFSQRERMGCRSCPIPSLTKALINPVEVPNTINLLSATAFITKVDSATLSLMVPLLSRGYNKKLAAT